MSVSAGGIVRVAFDRLVINDGRNKHRVPDRGKPLGCISEQSKDPGLSGAYSREFVCLMSGFVCFLVSGDSLWKDP